MADLSLSLVDTLRAYTLYHIVGCGGAVAVGQRHGRHRHIVYAERAAALLAVEVDVDIAVGVVVVAHAQFVAHAVTSVVYDMQQPVLAERGQCTEYARLVNSDHAAVQFGQRHRASCCNKSLDYQNTVGRRPHTMFFQKLCIYIFVHYNAKITIIG